MIINGRSFADRELSGVQRYASEIVKRFPEDKYVTIVPPKGWGAGIKGYVWEQCLPLKSLQDMIWSPANIGPAFYKNQVVTIHDISPLEHPEWFDRKYAEVVKLILPILVKNAKHIITVSNFSKERIINILHVPSRKITVIPLAAGNAFSPLGLVEQEKIRNQKGWPGRYFLSVGSLEPRKNLRNLFLAWENWKDRPIELSLLVAGGKGKVFSSMGFEKLPQGVVLLGRVDEGELPLLYACAEAFIYPSVYEGFGLPPLEAMASGTPVITSRSSSLPEVVGSFAQTVDPHNIEELTSSMRLLAKESDLRLEMRQAGLIRAKQFSWDMTADLTLQILMREERP